MRKIRKSAAQQQENRSKHQIRDCFEAYGWTSDIIETDLGEDIQIHVYHDGVASGVNFYVQLKSITNLYDRRKDSLLIYRNVEVKDLLHWEGFALPVILVVWDIQLKEGKWIHIQDELPQIDEAKPSWRTQQKVTIKFPWVNDTSYKGLQLLKAVIGKALWPLISKGKLFEARFKINIPDNMSNQPYQNMMNRLLLEGESIEMPGRFVQSLNFSEWYTEWFGNLDSSTFTFQLKPIQSESVFKGNLLAIDQSGTLFKSDTLIFRLSRTTLDNAFLTNEEDGHTPLRAKLILQRHHDDYFKIKAKYQVKHLNYSIQSLLDVYSFLVEYVNPSNKKFIVLDGRKTEVAPVDLERKKYDELVSIKNSLFKATEVQSRLGRWWVVQEQGIQYDDMRAVEELDCLTRNQPIPIDRSDELKLTVTNPKKKLWKDKIGTTVEVEGSLDEVVLNLFGDQIYLGKWIRHFVGLLDRVEKQRGSNKYDLYILDCEVAQTYPEFDPDGIDYRPDHLDRELP